MSEEIVMPGFKFIWAIENFSHALQESVKFIESPGLKMTASDEIEWRVLLYPRGYHAHEKQGTQQDTDICLALQNCTNEGIELSTEFELSLLSDNGEILDSFKESHTYSKLQFCGSWLNSRQVVLMKRRSEFLPKDTLTVCCRIWSINSKSVENASLYARSRIGVQKTSIIWSIDNFSKLQPKQKASILLESVSTQMDLYFPAEVMDCFEIQLDISQVDISKRNLLTCKISLLDANGKTVDSEEDEHFFDASKNECWKFPQFITRKMLLSERDRYLPRDILTLRCEFSKSVGLIENKIENYGSSLSQIVKPDDTSVLDNLNISKRTDKEKLLTFLYMDTVEDLQRKDCMDLYIASDNDIQYLKEKCTSLLRLSVNKSNVVELLMLADKHSDQSLKKHLQRFMQGREKDIFSTEEWNTLMTDNIRLAAEIMRELYLQK